jgi:hypothetical protein
MKATLLSTLFALISFSVFGQDVIYTNDGETIESKVTEIGKKEVRYKKFSNQSGPNYTISTSRIDRIVYENGSIENFQEASDKKESGGLFSVKPDQLGNNHIYLNVVDIIFQNVTFGYERILGDQRKVGIRIPLSFSLYGNSGNDFTFNSYNVFYSGLDFNFYPFGQRQASFYIGPSLRYGYARFFYSDYADFEYISTVTTDSYGSFLFNGGFTWNPVKELTITSSLGLGSKRYFRNAPNNRNTVTTASFWFAFGYRF